jgi:hypothetical protein
LASWDSIPEDEKPFQRRLMGVFAGFTEHADYNAGRVIDEIEKQGNLDKALILPFVVPSGSRNEPTRNAAELISALTWIRQFRSTTSIWRRSPSTAPSARPSSNTSSDQDAP